MEVVVLNQPIGQQVMRKKMLHNKQKIYEKAMNVTERSSEWLWGCLGFGIQLKTS